VPDVFFGLVVVFFGGVSVDVLAAGLDLLTILLVAWTFGVGCVLADARVATCAFSAVFTAFGLAAGAFLAAALAFGFTAMSGFAAFFAGLLTGAEVLPLAAVLGLIAALALALGLTLALAGVLTLGAIAPAFLAFAAMVLALGAFAVTLAFAVFLGFAAIVESNLLGHKKTGSKSRRNVTRSGPIRQESN
jgi:hypothetical protein